MAAVMPCVVVLDELTLLRVLQLCLAGKEVYLFRIDAIFAPLRPWLLRIANLLIAHGWLKPAAAIDLDAELFISRAALFGSLGWYEPVEAMLLAEVGLAASRTDPHELVFPLKKQCANHIADLLSIAHFLYQLRNSGAALPKLLLGSRLDGCVINRALAISGQSVDVEVPAVSVRGLFNRLLAVLVWARTAAHVLRRTRWSPPPPAHHYMGVDANDAPERTLMPARNILGEDLHGRLLMVFRSSAALRSFGHLYGDLKRACASEGVYSPGKALSSLWRAAAGLRWAVKTLPLDPILFQRAAKVVFLREVAHGFFRKYKVDVFWGQDEYNVEHVLRTEVLRRIGGRSVARINGVAIFKHDYVFRFVDYDAAYVISEPSFRKYNASTWRNSHSIIGVGTMSLGNADLAMVQAPRPDDILCFVKPFRDGRALLVELAKVARAFPDRTVTVAVKPTSERFGGYEEYLEFLRTEAPPNMVLSPDNSFHLILRHRYCLCSASSILVEAMELATPSFFFDVYGPEHVFIFRDYPELCLSEGEQIVTRIRGIEDGTQPYPWDLAGNLAKLSPENVYDMVRSDLGLSPARITRSMRSLEADLT